MGSTWGHPKAARRLSHHKCPETCVATTFTIWQRAPRKREHSQATRTPSTRGRQGRRGLRGPGGSRHSHSPVGKGRAATAVSSLLPQHSHPAGVHMSEQPQSPKIPEKTRSESRGLEGTGVLQTRAPGNHEGALTTPSPQQSQTLPSCLHTQAQHPASDLEGPVCLRHTEGAKHKQGSRPGREDAGGACSGPEVTPQTPVKTKTRSAWVGPKPGRLSAATPLPAPHGPQGRCSGRGGGARGASPGSPSPTSFTRCGLACRAPERIRMSPATLRQAGYRARPGAPHLAALLPQTQPGRLSPLEPSVRICSGPASALAGGSTPLRRLQRPLGTWHRTCSDYITLGDLGGGGGTGLNASCGDPAATAEPGSTWFPLCSAAQAALPARHVLPDTHGCPVPGELAWLPLGRQAGPMKTQRCSELWPIDHSGQGTL